MHAASANCGLGLMNNLMKLLYRREIYKVVYGFSYRRFISLKKIKQLYVVEVCAVEFHNE